MVGAYQRAISDQLGELMHDGGLGEHRGETVLGSKAQEPARDAQERPGEVVLVLEDVDVPDGVVGGGVGVVGWCGGLVWWVGVVGVFEPLLECLGTPP